MTLPSASCPAGVQTTSFSRGFQSPTPVALPVCHMRLAALCRLLRPDTTRDTRCVALCCCCHRLPLPPSSLQEHGGDSSAGYSEIGQKGGSVTKEDTGAE